MESPRVVPHVTWLDQFQQEVDRLATGQASRKQYGGVARTVGTYVCMPITCMPCLLWSTVMRVLCCPVSCMRGYGPLSNNGCTSMTDSCVKDCYNGYNCDAKCCKGPCNLDKMTIQLALKYAAEKMGSTPLVSISYRIADYALPLVKAEAIRQKTETLNQIPSGSYLHLEAQNELRKATYMTECTPLYVKNLVQSMT
jgi:hypothetical protein